MRRISSMSRSLSSADSGSRVSGLGRLRDWVPRILLAFEFATGKSVDKLSESDLREECLAVIDGGDSGGLKGPVGAGEYREGLLVMEPFLLWDAGFLCGM